ncbi:DUF6090 family protein [Geojedonia litorea]|uniref:DUF6090 family protein n=1 Tax=Geojedonia litorea TaxID=1268269 RepID=A0ABV9N512_9FLAO
MIKFFRKIRFNLMETGKTGKYLKYAAGEIVLVVIGILIALSINNWNNDRIENQKLNTYLKALKFETQNNINRLAAALTRASKDLQMSVETISKLNAETSKNLTSDDIINLNLGPIFKIELEQSVINEIMYTGVLEHLSNDSLKKKISRINLELEDYKTSYNHARAIWDDYMLPYHSKHINVTGLWDSINNIALPKLPFKNDLDAFVYNREYANILASRARMMGNLERDIKLITTRFNALVDELDMFLDE